MADNNELLREAVCNGNIHSVKKLIHNGASVNSFNAINGWTALHWAVKRGHIELIEYLLHSGADPLIKTFKGETPSMLTTNETILQLLPNEARGLTAIVEQTLPIVPNYLQNPTFPYTDMTQVKLPPPVDNMSSTSSRLSDMSISSANGKHTLTVKVRIADSGESDFVEVDVHGTSYHELLRSCCEELEVPLEEVSKLRKLPNVLIRKDRDIARLDNGQELELVKKMPL